MCGMKDTGAGQARIEALAFMRAHQSGVLATAEKDAQPHASAVYYTTDDDFNVYFLTLVSSRKYAAIQSNPRVAFSVGTQDVPQTMQLEGVADELRYEDENNQQLAQVANVLMSASTYYAPLTTLDRAGVRLMRITPNWIRWADYASGKTGTENVWTEIKP